MGTIKNYPYLDTLSNFQQTGQAGADRMQAKANSLGISQAKVPGTWQMPTLPNTNLSLSYNGYKPIGAVNKWFNDFNKKFYYDVLNKNIDGTNFVTPKTYNDDEVYDNKQERGQKFEKYAPYISEGLNTASGLLDSGKGQQGRSGISNIFGQLGQIGGKAGKAFQGLQMATAVGNFSDSMVTAISGTSESDQDSAWSKIPFATTFATALGGTASKYNGVNNHRGIDSGFAGVNNKIGEAQYRSGSHFGIGKANAAVENATRMNRDLNAIQMQTDMAMNNQAGQLYSDNLSQQYYGYQPRILTSVFAKTGIKLPTVQECREKLARAMKFKDGGKLEPNVIPEGALHKNKHHIEEVNEDLEGQITKKGIPVISYTKDGEVEQHAEIEKNEITFSKPVTEQIEKYYKEYEENQSDEAAIECGKFLVDQILHNTIDNTGLLKEVK